MMEETETIVEPERHRQSFWSTKMPTILAFSVCLLLFSLCFIQVRTSGSHTQKLTGFNLATGYTIYKQFPNRENNSAEQIASSQIHASLGEQKDPDIYTLVALGLGIMGLFLSIVNARPDGIGGILAGTLAAAALVCLWLNKGQVAMLSFDNPETFNTQTTRIQFTSWYYLLIIFFLIAAFFSYRRIRLNS